jgi:DNA-binding MarR family transcriptional regulator
MPHGGPLPSYIRQLYNQVMGLRISDVQGLASGIDAVAKWLRRQVPTQMSMSSLYALDRLRVEGPLRVSELAAVEAMTQPGVTILVNRLADAGYAERVPDPTDRRATLVRITDSGTALLAERTSTRAGILAARIAELSEHDQQLLVAALPALHRLVTPQPTPSDKQGRS